MKRCDKRCGNCALWAGKVGGDGDCHLAAMNAIPEEMFSPISTWYCSEWRGENGERYFDRDRDAAEHIPGHFYSETITYAPKRRIDMVTEAEAHRYFFLSVQGAESSVTALVRWLREEVQP